ncbi:MAG: beta-lactamase family protein [Acidobacteria bacterium]|nr:beta-lactamase family protein [Acidobacteriota bacterium]
MTLSNCASRFLLLSVLLLVSFGAGRAVTQQPKPVNFEELEKIVLDELRETKTPGAAVAVLSGGRVVFAKGFGAGNIETGAPVTPDTLFRLGSTTKMFTGAAPHRRRPLGLRGEVRQRPADMGDFREGWKAPPQSR